MRPKCQCMQILLDWNVDIADFHTLLCIRSDAILVIFPKQDGDKSNNDQQRTMYCASVSVKCNQYK